MKTCIQCHIKKPLDQFGDRGKNDKLDRCLKCYTVNKKRYMEEFKERNKAKGYRGKYSGTYASVHHWLRYYYGKANACEICNSSEDGKYYEWALKKGLEYQYNRENFMMLCNGCHKKYDRADNLELREKCRKNFFNNKDIVHTKRQVQQLDKNTLETIETFDSLTEAAKKLGIARTGISNVLANGARTAGGYKWKYLNKNK